MATKTESYKFNHTMYVHSNLQLLGSQEYR